MIGSHVWVDEAVRRWVERGVPSVDGVPGVDEARVVTTNHVVTTTEDQDS